MRNLSKLSGTVPVCGGDKEPQPSCFSGEGSPLDVAVTKLWSLRSKLQLIILAGMLILLTACDNGTGGGGSKNPPVVNPPAQTACQCPNGALHLTGENCCSGTGCECEKNVAGVRASNGLAITNRQGMADATFNTIVGYVNTALANGSLSGDTKQNCIKNNIKEIKVFNTTGTAVVTNNILMVYSGSSANGVVGALEDWLYDEHGMAMMMNQSNKEAYKHA